MPSRGNYVKVLTLSEVLTISVTFSAVHEVGRGKGVLTISVTFSTVHEVGREQGVFYLGVCTIPSTHYQA